MSTADQMSGHAPARAVRGCVLGGYCFAMVATMTACFSQETICSEGEYPVVNEGSFDGGDCVKDGNQPPRGYVRYPAHKVPVYVADDYTPDWQDYLDFGDKQQRKQARSHLR